jgi:hypothetical protein
MVSLLEIQQVAHKTTDEHGRAVVQIPLELWEAYAGTIPQREQPLLSQADRIKALLKEWENEPDDKSPEWWDEFDAFMKANPVDFGEPDLGFENE